MLAIFTAIALSTTSVPPEEAAALIIENARIWSDGRTGFAEFAAIDGGRFVYVGPRDEQYIGAHTKRLDAAGRVLIPGLIDSHIHMLGGGQQMKQLDLRIATDKLDFINRVAARAAQLTPGQWLLGGRWSTESWQSIEQPTKDWIDDVAPNNPAFLPRMDGHSALVNTAALNMAGITKDGPPNPAGGVIDRDPQTGEPTGMLRESAMDLVARLIPPANDQNRVQALRRAVQHAIAHGITAVGDIPELSDLDAYEQLRVENPPVRFFLFPTVLGDGSFASRISEFNESPLQLQINGIKLYLDGSLGSRTAYMHEPFCNNESHRLEWCGLLREGMHDGVVRSYVQRAREAGFQLIAHAIGDEANHILLNELEAAFGTRLAAARCRSEHAQHLLPADIQRFGDLGVIASMQPYHKADDGRYAEDYIGPDRVKSSYAFRSLLNAGAIVVFGSDWPVVTLNPFLGIEAAVTGRTLDGTLWQTQENITVAEALRAYTSHAAYGLGVELDIGRIDSGFLADFVILSHSPFDLDVDWSAISPVAVYVEGRQVYAADHVD